MYRGYRKKLQSNDGFVISNKKILSKIITLAYNQFGS